MFLPKPNTASLFSLMSGLIGRKRSKSVPTVQRDLSAVLSELEAGDRLYDARAKKRKKHGDRKYAAHRKQLQDLKHAFRD